MSEMAVIGQAGDTKVIWDKDNADEVAAARKTFDELVGEKKFAAFSVDARGDQGERIRRFDPEAEKIIIVPPMKGGN